VQAVRDTVWVPSPEYVALLERTNQQLSLWFNPYAIMVAGLAVLFTALGIAAAVAIYRQGKDHQRRIDEFLAGARQVLDDFITSTNQQVELAIEELRAQALAATGEQKKSIEAAIARIRRSREAAGDAHVRLGYLGSNPIRDAILSGNRPTPATVRDTHHQCKSCGFEWQQAEGADLSVLRCPKCGTVQSFQESLRP
jgi:hypothetical protein